MTFTGFIGNVNKLARGLNAIGLHRYHVIAICLPNMIEYAVLCHGALLAGGTVVGLIPAHTES